MTKLFGFDITVIKRGRDAQIKQGEQKMRKAYELMQDFNAVLKEVNEYKKAQFIRENGLAGKYWDAPADEMPKAEEVKNRHMGKYSEDIFEFVDGTVLYIAQYPYRWNRKIWNNYAEKKEVKFEPLTSLSNEVMTKFAFNGGVL